MQIKKLRQEKKSRILLFFYFASRLQKMNKIKADFFNFSFLAGPLVSSSAGSSTVEYSERALVYRVQRERSASLHTIPFASFSQEISVLSDIFLIRSLSSHQPGDLFYQFELSTTLAPFLYYPISNQKEHVGQCLPRANRVFIGLHASRPHSNHLTVSFWREKAISPVANLGSFEFCCNSIHDRCFFPLK